jgi:hypothetical protein
MSYGNFSHGALRGGLEWAKFPLLQYTRSTMVYGLRRFIHCEYLSHKLCLDGIWFWICAILVFSSAATPLALGKGQGD